MDDALLATVLERLDGDALDSSAVDLILAACESDQSLAEAVGGAAPGRPALTAEVEVNGEQAALAYLTGVTVEGFRGVGETSTLELRPGPGLTVVVGRNGSGKSSFAEAIEVALTGSLRRWEERSAVWREGWRNLHHQGNSEVVVSMHLERHPGTTTVRRRWCGDKLDDATTTVQVAGERQDGIERLGWRQALADYRPFLSHFELETMLAKPSELFERLAEVLGLDELSAASKRITAALKEQKKVVNAAKQDLPRVLDRLRQVDDERASACLTALGGKEWDLDAAEQIAAGRSLEDRSEVGFLRALASLVPPDGDRAEAAVQRLRAAADALADASRHDAVTAQRLAGLLEAALVHHDHHGDGDCPVCGRTGALDASWRSATVDEVARLQGEYASLDRAKREAQQAAVEARSLVTSAPAALGRAAEAGFDVTAVGQAWAAWYQAPPDRGAGGLSSLAEHLERRLPDLLAAVEELSDRAGAEADRRDDAWSPVATEVASWCSTARRSLGARAKVEALSTADAWLKATAEELRNERLRPLAQRAGEVWAQLRQESNVELGGMRLAGSATRRRVDLDVTVDGVRGAALGVMSQGEVNALALAIFVPRATLPPSPFGFLVIDDPVQAMDPAKVQGLARVFQQAARRRQVVVFTHDDRLPEAIRRLAIDARVLEVTRRAGSLVEVRTCDDPATRSLADARALCCDEALPTELVRRVVPGLCRAAVESVLLDGTRRQLLGKGMEHAEAERRLGRAGTLMERGALGLFGDASKGSHVYARLNTYGSWAADTFRACNEGAHGRFDGHLDLLVGDTRRLVAKLREVLA